MRALHETLAAEQSTKTRAVQNGEGWAARLDSWIASHPVVSHLVDDSRESIYDGRGE